MLVALLFPVGLFGLLFAMAWLEDTLPGAVRRSSRRPDPAPILSMPSRQRSQQAEVATTVQVPVQREVQASEVARVGEVPGLSLGGSTNR